MIGLGKMQQRKLGTDRTPKGNYMKPNPLFPVHSKREAALAAWPLFGGTTPGGPADPPAATPPAATPPAATPPAPTTEVDPIKELAKDPAKLSQLLSQVTTLTTQQATLAAENEAFKAERTKAEQAKLTKEQQLETTIAQKDATILAATALLSAKSLENALLNLSDFTWQDANDALMNLKDNPAIKVTVDIEKQIAQVDGLEAAAKDLATRKPWMLKTPEVPPTTPPPAGRPTGAPPPPIPPVSGDKLARRKALAGKYSAIKGVPVVAQG